MLFEKYAKAWDTKNIEMLANLCHPDFEMVTHSSVQQQKRGAYIASWTSYLKIQP